MSRLMRNFKRIVYISSFVVFLIEFLWLVVHGCFFFYWIPFRQLIFCEYIRMRSSSDNIHWVLSALFIHEMAKDAWAKIDCYWKSTEVSASNTKFMEIGVWDHLDLGICTLTDTIFMYSCLNSISFPSNFVRNLFSRYYEVQDFITYFSLLSICERSIIELPRNIWNHWSRDKILVNSILQVYLLRYFIKT